MTPPRSMNTINIIFLIDFDIFAFFGGAAQRFPNTWLALPLKLEIMQPGFVHCDDFIKEVISRLCRFKNSMLKHAYTFLHSLIVYRALIGLILSSSNNNLCTTDLLSPTFPAISRTVWLGFSSRTSLIFSFAAAWFFFGLPLFSTVVTFNSVLKRLCHVYTNVHDTLLNSYVFPISPSVRMGVIPWSAH